VPYSGDKWVTSSGPDRYRRGIYTFWRRSAPYPSFVNFDAPSREQCTIRRVRTNTPLQALSVLNDPQFVESAKGLARRMIVESSGDVAARVAFGFEVCTSRKPKADELAPLVNLYEQELRRYREDAPAAEKMAAGIQADGADPAQAAAWAVVANVLMNLDESLTKG